jgi:acetamidase/formamidase
MVPQQSAPYILKAIPENIHIGYFSADLKPVLTIRSGDAVEIETTRADAPEEVDAALRPEVAALVRKRLQGGPGPHTLTGPIYIEGAEPGHVLEVRIEDIRLRTRYGLNRSTEYGILYQDFPTTFTKTFFCIDLERQSADEILPGITIPLRPFFGNLGVAPPHRFGHVDSKVPGLHCGNIDVRDLVAGTTLYMPVHVNGALFSAGDGHACQSDGEADGTALETPLTGVFRFIIRNDLRLKRPMAETPTHYMTIAYHKNLKWAAKLALKDMVRFVVETKNLTEEDAYALLSLAGEMHVSQLVNIIPGVHFMLPKGIFH